jgi:hypothetical protein
MDYFISRDGQQYGPYTLADLQRYAASGEVSLADLAISEGMTEPVSVAQIIGTIAAAPPPVAGAPISMADMYPDPPNLHWGLVLLFSILTCGFFVVAWDLVQAAWMKRVDPTSKAIFIYGAATAVVVCLFFVGFFSALNHTAAPQWVGLLQVVSWVLYLVGRYSLRASLEEHYNGPEPMGLILSGVMTFFFGGIYFQYHINDIVRRKAADRMFAAVR